MESGYEINVSYKGSHFFRTNRSAARFETPARKLYRELKKRFKVSDGYEIDVTYYSFIGNEIDPKDKVWGEV